MYSIPKEIHKRVQGIFLNWMYILVHVIHRNNDQQTLLGWNPTGVGGTVYSSIRVESFTGTSLQTDAPKPVQ